MKFLKDWCRFLPLLFLAGCAGWARDCSSCNAESFGADWVIVQYRADGSPLNCWQQRSVAVVNEGGSDGIWWQSNGGHLVHISGWYNRVQVAGGNFAEAASQLSVDLSRCPGGRYVDAKPIPNIPVSPVEIRP